MGDTIEHNRAATTMMQFSILNKKDIYHTCLSKNKSFKTLDEDFTFEP